MGWRERRRHERRPVRLSRCVCVCMKKIGGVKGLRHVPSVGSELFTPTGEPERVKKRKKNKEHESLHKSYFSGFPLSLPPPTLQAPRAPQLRGRRLLAERGALLRFVMKFPRQVLHRIKGKRCVPQSGEELRKACFSFVWRCLLLHPLFANTSR